MTSNTAAEKIQRRWKIALAKKTVNALRTERNYITELTIWNTRNECAILIQVIWKATHRVKTLRAKEAAAQQLLVMVDYINACITIQVKWRYLKNQRKHRNDKAIVIQSALRTYFRKKNASLRCNDKVQWEAAITIQAFWKGRNIRIGLNNELIRKPNAAAIIIQNLFRRLTAVSIRRRLQEDSDLQLSSEILSENAALIQSAYRLHQERSAVLQKKKEEELFVVSEAQKKISAALVIQSWVLVCKLKSERRIKNSEIQQQESASVIQTAILSFQSKFVRNEKQLCRDLEKNNIITYEAARTIQTIFKSKMASRNVNKLRTIRQNWLNETRIESYNDSKPYLLEIHSTIIQSFALSKISFLLRNRLRHGINIVKSSLILQSLSKGYQSRLRSFRQFDERRHAAIVLQIKLPLLLTYRLLRRQAKISLEKTITERKSREREVIISEAAIAIQCAFRKKNATDVTTTLIDFRSQLRSKQIEEMNKAEYTMLTEFATSLQCRWRIYKANTVFNDAMARNRVEQRILFEKEEHDWNQIEIQHNNSATRIQSIFRGYSVRNKIHYIHSELLQERAEGMLLDSVVQLQAFFRGVLVRNNIGRLQKLQNCASFLKRVSMGYRDRMFLFGVSRMEIQSQCVTTITKAYRAHLARKIFIERKNLAEIKRVLHFKIMSAINIQKSYRGYTARKLVVTRKEDQSKRHKAATDISRCYKGHFTRVFIIPPVETERNLSRDVRQICDASLTITRVVRGHLSRKKVSNYKRNRLHAIPVLQSLGRALSSRRQLFKKYASSVLHSNAIIIQKTYRMHAAIEQRKVLAIYEKEHRLEIRWRELAACRIQKVIRAGVSRLYCAYGCQRRLESGLLLTRLFRSFSIRKSILPTYKLQQLTTEAIKIQRLWKSERSSIREKVIVRDLERQSQQLYMNAFFRSEPAHRWSIENQYRMLLENAKTDLQELQNDERRRFIDYMNFVSSLGVPFANAAAKLIQETWLSHKTRLVIRVAVRTHSDTPSVDTPVIAAPFFASSELPKGKVMDTWSREFINKLSPNLKVILAEETAQRHELEQLSLSVMAIHADGINETPRKQVIKKQADDLQWEHINATDRELDERRYELQMSSRYSASPEEYSSHTLYSLDSIESLEIRERRDVELMGLFMAEAIVRPLQTKGKKVIRSTSIQDYSLPPLRTTPAAIQESTTKTAASDITYFASTPTGGIGTRAMAVSQLETLQRQIYQNEPLVTFVSVADLPIREEDICQLIVALKHNTHVVSLDLSNTEIRDATAEELSRLMIVNNTLVYINLSGTRISDIGASHLASSIPANVALRKIDLSSTLVSLDITTAIEDTLRIRVLALQQGKFRPPKGKSKSKLLRPPPPPPAHLSGISKKNSLASPRLVTGMVADSLSVLSCSKARVLNNAYGDLAPLGVPSLSDPFVPVAPSVNSFSPGVGV